jgi:hypothetical protein
VSTPQAERSLLDRYLAAIPFVIGTLAILSLLFWEAAIRKSPTIFTDELEWSQLSRAIAATGHAARRGEPFAFKSLYAYLIAPGWWIHSTSSAYAAIKYLNTIVMALTAIPVYLLARTMVSTRIAAIAALVSLCTTAVYYAAFLIPEVLAYPTFVLCAYVSIRALAGGGRKWIAAAIVLDLLAIEVRSELVMVPATFALAALVLWVVGPSGQRLRRDWRAFDYVGAALLILGGLIVLNELASPHAQQWAYVSGNFPGRIFSLGMQAAEALAIGLGLLPFVGGLASLWIPERRTDRAWRAFAAFSGSALFTFWLYTGVKAAYLSTTFATRVEERNMIYLGPLLIVGTAVWLCSNRRWLPGALAALAFTAWLVIYYGYQLDYPYFEAPGYGIATMANRAWHWDQPTIRLGLTAACIVLLAFVLSWSSRVPRRAQRATMLLACVTALTWMLAGEITSSRGSAVTARTYVAADHFPQPYDWIDRATSQAGTTFLGQNLSTLGLAVNLLEFWNRSVKHIWSLDGTAPGPGHSLTPDLSDRYGTLSHDPGLRYVVATTGVNLIGPVVASKRGYTLRAIEQHPWRLHDAVYSVSDDGWISGSGEDPSAADGTYAYFGPETKPGSLTIVVSRSGFCSKVAPGTHVTVRVGPLALNEQHAPSVAHATWTRKFPLQNCGVRHFTVAIAPPLAVEVHADPTVRPTDYGASDNRFLGAQVAFSFSAKQ